MSEHADTIRRVLVDVREKQLREDEMRVAAVEALICLDAILTDSEIMEQNFATQAQEHDKKSAALQTIYRLATSNRGVLGSAMQQQIAAAACSSLDGPK